MKKLETQATSHKTAVCNPIVLRETERVRLVFLPTLVDNTVNPKASVDGEFMYQRKAATGRWLPAQSVALSTLKQGEGFHLKIHAQELRTLLEGLVPLYHFYDQQGVPPGKKTFVQVEPTLAELVSAGEKDLAAFVRSQPDKAAETLLKLVRWLTTAPGSSEAASRLVGLAPEQIPAFTALLGLASIKDALAYWKANQSNTSEEFWQRALAERSYVLSQVFAYPIIVIGSKAYVGGKQITNKSGKQADFLAMIESTRSVILVEIKTPQTKLLGTQYRDGVFPISPDLAGSLAQVLRYRQSLTRTFDSVTSELSQRLTLGEPRCVVIAGNSSQFGEQAERENFELQREQLRGVTLLTYDELFRRLERLVSLLEGARE